MLPLEAELEHAVRLHRAGQLAEARQEYEQFVRSRPNHADAHNLLGFALRQLGELDQAARTLRRAIDLDGTQAAFHANLGEVHNAQGRMEEAIDCYRKAAEVEPRAVRVHLLLAGLLDRAGKADEAVASLRRAIELAPEDGEANFLLAQALDRAGMGPQATEYFKRAVAANPRDAGLRVLFAQFLLREQQFVESEAQFRESISLGETMAAVLGLGTAVQQQGRLDDAKGCYRRALELDPLDPTAIFNMATVLHTQGAHRDADSYYRRLEHVPEFRLRALSGSGSMALMMSDRERAKECFRQALELDPENADMHFFLGTTLISEGQFAEGWPHFEYRSLRSGGFRRDFMQPRWDGQPLDGGTILAHGEFGYGDALQFVRFIPAMIEQAGGAKVCIEVAGELIPLLTQSGFRNLVAYRQPLPPFDAHVPLMSLPGILGTTVEKLPNHMPYLSVDEGHVDRWRERLNKFDGFRIGIHWQGRRSYIGDEHRSFALQEFEPLARIDSVRLVSLQKGPGTEQIAQASDRFEVIQLAEMDVQGGAFVDTAAVIRNLDLVITSDSAVAHVAGALGAPTWLVLPKPADWRWMIDREDTPWYPTMRLWRQRQLDDWAELFSRVYAALTKLVHA